ncbi:hypothetical protein GLYMA_04G058700v4 [Glycine max]|uniref:Uncharacterized protein n=1 Tax=Glycine max TaxID=3847 RepID=K7KIC4_SOYBN|nr:hypothetical protein GYH30_009070 [Glycine max]KRH61626.1 hypothetical protein GLYMA_04G058700v4 [Glycine max]
MLTMILSSQVILQSITNTPFFPFQSVSITTFNQTVKSFSSTLSKFTSDRGKAPTTFT